MFPNRAPAHAGLQLKKQSIGIPALARERGDDTRRNQEWEFDFKSKTDPADATLTIPHRAIREVGVFDRPTKAPVRVDAHAPRACIQQPSPSCRGRAARRARSL